MRTILHLVSIFISISVKLSGQNATENIRNIVPPSPQAFEMGKYGNIPLNEYHGMAQISIPIADVKDHNIFSNVSLNYSNLGVKVADIPTNVGMSWLLQMGGVITRTVYDLPDEDNSTNRILLNYSEIQNIKTVLDKSTGAEVLNSYHLNTMYDNEIDIFQFSVNGLSGKFFLDENLNPILLSRNSLLKIATIGDFKTAHKFIITDVDGTQYYFGGSEAIERTFIRNQTNASNNVTSFYLTKIKSVTNNEINFNYNILNNTSRTYWLGRQEILPVETHSYTEEDVNLPPGSTFPISDMFYNFEEQTLRVKNPIELSSIVSTDKTIKINYFTISNSSYRGISSVDMLNTLTNKLTKTIDFEYLYHEKYANTIRFFLNNIKNYNYYDNNKIFESEHSFTYDNPLELPDIKSFSVDVYGYYNGQNNNNSFLPDLKKLYMDDEEKKYDFSKFPSYHYANRNSSFAFSKKGTLESIKYPTKGTTHFEYEGIDSRENTYAEKTLLVHNVDSLDVKEYLVNGADVLNDHIEGSVIITQNNINPLSRNIDVFFSIVNVETGATLYKIQLSYPKPLEGEQNPDRSKSENFIFNTNKNTTYKLILSLIKKENVDYNGELNFSYVNGYNKKNDIGLRLKRMYDSDATGNVFNIKRLYYTAYNEIYNAYPFLINNPYPQGFVSDAYRAGILTTNVGMDMNVYPVAKEFKLLSSNYSPISKWDDYFENFSFRDVTISFGGDNFEKGGEEKVFKSGGYKQLQILRTPVEMDEFYYGQNLFYLTQSIISKYERTFLFDDFNGKLMSSKIIANKGNNNLVLISKTTYNYNYNIENLFYNLIVEPAYNIPVWKFGYTANNSVFNLFAAYSPLPSYNTSPLGSVETTYLENVPVGIQDDSTYKKLTTTTEYFYNNPTHNQLTNQITVLPDKSISETTYQYAHEKGKTNMVAANMVGIPIETEVKKYKDSLDVNPKTISKSGLDYKKQIIGGKELILPDFAYSYDLQNSTDSTKVVKYNQYDDKGNLLQYTLKPDSKGNGGIPVAIIWGYNQTQPIAKIEGAKLSDIPQGLITNIVNASDYSNPSYSESSLITQLDAFRKGLSAYQVSTYTYKPLIGVTTITPPSGIREYYIYDTANRLQSVKDINGKILKEYKYNYKP